MIEPVGSTVSTLIVAVALAASVFVALSADQYVIVCEPSGIETAPEYVWAVPESIL